MKHDDANKRWRGCITCKSTHANWQERRHEVELRNKRSIGNKLKHMAIRNWTTNSSSNAFCRDLKVVGVGAWDYSCHQCIPSACTRKYSMGSVMRAPNRSIGTSNLLNCGIGHDVQQQLCGCSHQALRKCMLVRSIILVYTWMSMPIELTTLWIGYAGFWGPPRVTESVWRDKIVESMWISSEFLRRHTHCTSLYLG